MAQRIRLALSAASLVVIGGAFAYPSQAAGPCEDQCAVEYTQCLDRGNPDTWLCDKEYLTCLELCEV